MLVLSRKIGEVVTVGTSVKITILSYERGVVRLGIEAPKSIPIHRKEVYDKIIEINRLAAKTELSALKNAITGGGFSLNINKNVKQNSLNFFGMQKLVSSENSEMLED
jgi:carbon storage regulator